MVEQKKSFHTGGDYSSTGKDRAGHEQMHLGTVCKCPCLVVLPPPEVLKWR